MKSAYQTIEFNEYNAYDEDHMDDYISLSLMMLGGHVSHVELSSSIRRLHPETASGSSMVDGGGT